MTKSKCLQTVTFPAYFACLYFIKSPYPICQAWVRYPQSSVKRVRLSSGVSVPGEVNLFHCRHFVLPIEGCGIVHNGSLLWLAGTKLSCTIVNVTSLGFFWSDSKCWPWNSSAQTLILISIACLLSPLWNHTDPPSLPAQRGDWCASSVNKDSGGSRNVKNEVKTVCRAFGALPIVTHTHMWKGCSLAFWLHPVSCCINICSQCFQCPLTSLPLWDAMATAPLKLQIKWCWLSDCKFQKKSWSEK